MITSRKIELLMKLFQKTAYKRTMAGGMLGALLLFASCSEDDGLNSRPATGGDDVVRISASLAPTVESRAYQEQGTIESGQYFMTYPNDPENATHSVCTDNFHDGFGVTTTQNGKELKWMEVGSLTYDTELTNFFLDNVPPPEDNPNATTVPFTDKYNPFVAGEFDNVEGKNDLLWGYIQPKLNTTEEINIGIHHYMSRVSVIVTVNNSSENANKILFDKGSVKISNVVHEGVSFNRLNGTIDLGPEPEYKDLVLTDGGDWQSITPDEERQGIVYYQSKNFVIPPQELRTDIDRPRLILNVPMEDGSIRSYSGVIPRIMFVNGVPANLGFDPEKNLTLKVKLSADLLKIEEVVAELQDWIDKGTFIISGARSDVKDQKELYELIELYNNLEDELDLRKFGFYEDGLWKFDLFTIIRLYEGDDSHYMYIDEDAVFDKLAGSMADGPDFRFIFGYDDLWIYWNDGTSTAYRSVPGEDGSHASSTNLVADEILYQLLRNGVKPKQPAE